MKKRIIIAMLCSLSGFAAASYAEDKIELKTDVDKASYAVGIKYGEGIKKDLSDLSLPVFVRGLQDAYYQRTTALSADEMDQILGVYQQKKLTEIQKAHDQLAAENKKKGEAFLASNKKKKGVTVTASGLQYQVMKVGQGAVPTISSKVKVHYHGTLIDGTVFDSSVQRGEPISFPVNGVIPGWTEALQLMKVGSKWKLFVPANLAYGERGTRGVIGPNAVLIFEVELLAIES